MTKITISIGVSDAAGLTHLPAAAPSARTFADWARGRGFDVHEFNDLDGPVKSAKLLDEVGELVELRGIEQIIVFFAGHGMAGGPDEDYWFLSDGYGDLIDASNSIRRARNIAKLRHVVFFADACRTSAATEHLHAGPGSPAFFPAKATGNRIATIDVFNGTISGKAALEAAGRREDGKVIAANGIFTEALQEALEGNIDEVITLQRGTGARVIYAHALKPYLEARVRRESSRRAAWTQHPDCRPDSGESLVLVELQAPQLADLTIRAVLADGSPAHGSSITILDVYADPLRPREIHEAPGPEISRELPGGMYGVRAEMADHLQDPKAPEPISLLMGTHDPVEVTLLPATSLAGDDVPVDEPLLLDRYVIDDEGRRFDRPPEAGIYTVVNEDVLTGRVRSELRPLEAHAAPRLRTLIGADVDAERRLHEMANSPARDHYETMTGVSISGAAILDVRGRHRGWGEEGEYWYVRGQDPGSVLVNLGEIGWAGLGEFPGFFGEAIAGEKGIESLRYLPAPGGPWDWDGLDREESRQLLMIAETAARVGRFHLIDEHSVRIAGEMRRFKHQNPMLGVYAAYAYAEAGSVDQIDDMIAYFADEDQSVPFDVALLARASIPDIRAQASVVPDFPILRRGWRHLDGDAPIPAILVEARRHVGPAMFTTFRGPIAVELGATLEQGEIW